MLNKKQSSKSSSWKYATILPALAAFMLAFQVKVVAQEKENHETKVVTQTKVKFAVEVNKDSKDEELKAESKVFKEEFDADVNFQNITRNTKNEITAIKVTVKDKSQSKVYEVAGTEPIVPFTLELEKGSKSDKNTIVFGSPKQIRFTADHMYYHEGDSLSKHKIIRGYTGTIPTPPAPPVPNGPNHIYTVPPAMPASPSGNWTVNSMKINNEDLLIVINGKKQEKGESIKLGLDEDIDTITMLSDKEGKKKYGKEGKKGVMEITTKKSNSWAIMRNPEVYMQPGRSPQSMSFGYDFNNDDMARMREGLNVLEDFEVYELGDPLMNTEEIARMQNELARMQDALKNAKVGERLNYFGDEISDDEMAKIRKELREAQKEIQQARKEMMETRREMERDRKDEIKKKAESARAKKTSTQKA